MRKVNTGERKKMQRHSYLTHMDTDLWDDLQKLKKLDNQSINSLMNTAVRKLIKERVSEVAQMRKTRNTLDNMVSV